MGLRIHTNTASLAVQREVRVQSGAEQVSSEKLGSGKRIRSAVDDAAGLSVSEKGRALLRSSLQGTRNALDGISAIQVAEGGLNEGTNILVRLRELSMQAASDTVGQAERGYLDKEFQALVGEMARISNVTEFNGTNLLNQEAKFFEVQVDGGSSADENRLYIDLRHLNVNPDNLQISGLHVGSKEQARQNLGAIDGAISRTVKARARLGAIQNRFHSAVNNSQISQENSATTISRIRDVDVAYETAEQARSGILANAGTSLLSQIDSGVKINLKLLGLY